jgi:hypothetical protein
MNTPIDWEQLAQQLGLLRPDGGEIGGSDSALRAIELLLGESRLQAAVDFYVSGTPGSELARQVLWQLRPWSAMQRCYEIYRSGADVDTRCAAVELLRVVADRRALSWVQEFLDDPEPGIQNWGAGVLDQLLWSRLVQPDECAKLLESMGTHPNASVRGTAEWIHSFLRKRETGAELGAVADRPRE